MTLLQLSASGALLILAAALLRGLTFRRLPKGAFVALWWVAAVRLLVPAELPAPCSVYTLLRTLTRSPAPAPLPQTAARPIVILPVPSAQAPLPSAPAPDPIPAGTVLWLAVAGLLGLWFLTGYLRWMLRFREALPVDCPPLPARTRLRMSDRVDAPLTYGLLRPVILLPKSMDLSDRDALRCVLAHEAVHIRRLDCLLKILLAAALCVHWFNPAVWLLYILANRDMELRCDEEAVLALGEDQRALYALTLLRMAELQNASMPLCSSFSKSGMEERIKAIMHIKKRSLLAILAALALVACVTGAFATTAWEEKTPQPSSPAPLEALESSIGHDGRNYYFTVPAGEGRWNIWLSGRLATKDGAGMSVHYLEEESEKGQWTPGTYTFETQEGLVELVMTASFNDDTATFDLTDTLPETGPAGPALPEWKDRVPADAEMIWPVDSTEITNGFGSRADPGGQGATEHSGVDIGGMEQGTAIYAAASGTVKEAGFDSKSGNFVRLDHGNGLETFYAHCAAVKVQAGDTVTIGQTIATVGSSGQSTGPHLHFEILLDGVAQNPEVYLTQKPEPAGPVGQEGSTPLPDETPVVTAGNELAGDGTRPFTEKNSETPPAPTAEPMEEPMGMQLQREQLVNGEYPTNDKGETYGNTFGSDLTGHEPDLLAAIGTNGEHGYISMEDQHFGSRSGDYFAYENWLKENNVSGYLIPLYDKDHNVIGDFQVDNVTIRDGVTKTFDEMNAAMAQGWPNANGSTPQAKEPIFKSLEEAQEAAENGWVGTSTEGYYEDLSSLENP